jgi:hypothetical protein
LEVRKVVALFGQHLAWGVGGLQPVVRGGLRVAVAVVVVAVAVVELGQENRTRSRLSVEEEADRKETSTEGFPKLKKLSGSYL